MRTEKLKYWLLTTEYPPEYGGGISTYAHYTAKILSKYNHEVSVFIYDLRVKDVLIEYSDKVRIIRFNPNKTSTDSFLGFHANLSYEYAFIVGSYIKKEGAPDIIESQEYHGIAYYLQQFKLLGYAGYSNLNILITCHAPSFICLEYNHVPIYKFPYYWTGQMEKASIKCADILISPSRYFITEAKKRMDWEGINEMIIPNPIHSNNFSNDYSYKENYIVCFGKLSPLKGTFRLLEYFKVLWDEGFIHPLRIIGGTDQLFHPEGKTMKELITKRYGLYLKKRLLILAGDTHPEKAKQIIQDAHVVIVPSLFDNLPYTALEAMSIGKIVLASKQGGQSEVIVDGDNGFLFDHHTPNDFRKKLQYILGLSASEIKQIGENAATLVHTHFSPDRIYEKKILIIKDFLNVAKKRTLFPFTNAITATASLKESDANRKLSIVIPFYNMGEYITDCVVSALQSDYTDKEIIIVDDGSTDPKSIEVLKKLETKYPLTIYRKQNEGLPRTRNYGAEKATGYYLAFLDADDTIEKSYYKKAIHVISNYSNVHFVGCWTKYTGNSKGNWPTFNPEPPYLLIHNMINSSALVYRKKTFIQAGLNNPSMEYGMEDWDSVISMIKHNYFGVVLPELLFNYRIRKGSMARSFTEVKQLYLQNLISENHKPLYEKFGSDIFQLLNANGSSLYFDNPTFAPPTQGYLSLLNLNNRLTEKIKKTIKRNKQLRKIAYKIYNQIKK